MYPAQCPWIWTSRGSSRNDAGDGSVSVGIPKAVRSRQGQPRGRLKLNPHCRAYSLPQAVMIKLHPFRKDSSLPIGFDLVTGRRSKRRKLGRSVIFAGIIVTAMATAGYLFRFQAATESMPAN